MKLNEKQQMAYDAVVRGENVCITGEGGTGKSVIIKAIKENMASDTIFLAPTGIAAINIDGMTCHSAFGAPLGLPTPKELLTMSHKAEKTFGSDKIKRIVIDEVFMVRADLFDYMDNQLKKVRKSGMPFGGLQVVVVGDPLQLKAFIKWDSKEGLLYQRKYGTSLYPFQTQSWESCKFNTVLLTEPMRQSEEGFLKALDSIRKGDQNCEKAVKWLNVKAKSNSPKDAVVLATTNKVVDKINQERFEKHDGKLFTNKASKRGMIKPEDVSAPENLELKEGCRVIILANCPEQTYANGMTGVFVGSTTIKDPKEGEKLYTIVELDNTGEEVYIPLYTWEKKEYVEVGGEVTKQVVGSFVQYPLRLGYAISIHKSQGMTLEKAEVDLGRGAFAEAQTYIALSRLKSLSGLKLRRPIKVSDVLVCTEALDFYTSLVK